VLAGRKPDKLSPTYPDYDHYIRQLQIQDYVRWIGFVDEEDKPILFRSAEAFVFPSRHEGFGLPVLEAMASGTPVVAANAGALPEVVGNAAFTVGPDDARQMAGAIISLLIEDNTRADLQKKGLAQAARFSWEKTADETLLVYDRLMRRHR